MPHGAAAEHAALKLSEARLRTIVASEPECVKTVDRDCRLLDMNPAGLAMVGADSIDQVRGVSLLELVVPEHHARFERTVRDCFAGETVLEQFEIISLDGTRRWMEQNAAPLYDPSTPGVVSEMVAVTREITERKRYEASMLEAVRTAEQASLAKTAFLANMSHEIRTPMNGMLGTLNALAHTALDAEQQGLVEVIQRSGQSLLRILNDILDVSRIESGHVPIDALPVRLSDLVHDVVEQFRHVAVEQGVSLSVTHCTDSTGTRLGDPTRIAQILRNLVSNALKFTPEGAVRLEVCACSAGSSLVEFVVTDTGIGMTDAQLGRVFDRFVQADETASRRYGGTGLGLAIVRSLATRMGGTVTATSGVGEGSTFVVRLPLPAVAATTPSSSTSPCEPDGEAAGATQPLRVLLVDDNELNRQVVAHMLPAHRYALTLCASGAEALEQALRARYDVVLMDIHMPDMDGIETLRRLRTEEARAGRAATPAVAYTASVTNDEVARYAAHGFQGCIAKPVEPARLAETLRRFTAG